MKNFLRAKIFVSEVTRVILYLATPTSDTVCPPYVRLYPLYMHTTRDSTTRD